MVAAAACPPGPAGCEPSGLADNPAAPSAPPYRPAARSEAARTVVDLPAAVGEAGRGELVAQSPLPEAQSPLPEAQRLAARNGPLAGLGGVERVVRFGS